MLPIRSILCPTDFSPPANSALVVATELAKHFGGEVCLAHVIAPIPLPSSDPAYDFEMPEYEKELHADADAKLAKLRAELAGAGVSVRGLIGHGDPAGEIVELAAEQKSDLIVIATHGMTGWRHLVFGSVAEKVVRLAPCPVLTIRAPKN